MASERVLGVAANGGPEEPRLFDGHVLGGPGEPAEREADQAERLAVPQGLAAADRAGQVEQVVALQALGGNELMYGRGGQVPGFDAFAEDAVEEVRVLAAPIDRLVVRANLVQHAPLDEQRAAAGH